ncbi:MAG: 4-hydroxy-tetrahydrodipicolinate reductase [Clostridia bacterium]|jgi:4-hydroxy-tetrahydrodipicolinate reductase|nr:4-hydroxy-tetrahydrodipicolinate reductase [Clostridiales bacterium]
MIKAVLNGCNGKMGRMISEEVSKVPDIEIVAGVDKNADVNPCGYPVFESIDLFNGQADVIIDFSRPDSVFSLVPYAIDTKTALMVATTGLSKEHSELLERAAKTVPVFHTANMSVGVNVVKDLCRSVASVLTEGFDVEITEFHHNQKADAPSGTALMLAEAVRDARGGNSKFVYGRAPQTGKRTESEIGIHAVRGGTMPGEHSVLFAGPDEIIEIRHLALSRRIFALGTLRAARFIVRQGPGLYNMDSTIS